jgi:hypothetical protein
MANSTNTTESDILSDVIAANRGDLSPEVAKSVLKWKFKAAAVRRINKLADRNRKGTITDAEREQLQRYLRVGSLVNLIQAKARLSLQSADSTEA